MTQTDESWRKLNIGNGGTKLVQFGIWLKHTSNDKLLVDYLSCSDLIVLSSWIESNNEKVQLALDVNPNCILISLNINCNCHLTIGYIS